MPHAFHSSPYQHMLRILTQARRDAGITQSELAQRMGRRQTFVSKVEQGERRLDLIELIIWCRLLDTDVHHIVSSVELEVSDSSL